MPIDSRARVRTANTRGCEQLVKQATQPNSPVSEGKRNGASCDNNAQQLTRRCSWLQDHASASQGRDEVCPPQHMRGEGLRVQRDTSTLCTERADVHPELSPWHVSAASARPRPSTNRTSANRASTALAEARTPKHESGEYSERRPPVIEIRTKCTPPAAHAIFAALTCLRA